MAVTQNTYTGNGSTTNYSFTFPYLETTDIKVSLNGTVTTAYTLANATTIQFNTAPANGAAIRIYRQTDDSALAATFYPGSAIRSSDLNDNFTQNLYVTQESSNSAAAATTTANTALTNSTTAINTANASTATANTALSNSQTALTQSASAVSTANSASSSASSAVSTANSAAADAATALTQSSAAVATANTSASNAATALSNSQTALTQSASALSASAAATSTANTAAANAASAVSTANTASSNAAAALNAVANSVQYQLVAAVANIPASPSNGDAIEIANSTGIESFSPLANRPAGFVGDTGLSVRMQYSSAGSTWNWLNYFSNDSDTRYLKKSGGTLTGALTLNADPTQNLQAATKQYVDNVANAGGLPLTGGTMTGQILGDNSTSPTTPGYAFDGDPNTGMYRPGADELALATGGTARLTIDPAGAVAITNSLSVGGQAAVVTNDARLTDTRTPTDGTVTDAKVAANAAIAGTKISPDFGTQNVTTSGNITVTNQGDIRLGEATANGSNYVALQAPASLAADVTYTLPSADGTSGQVLSTNGSGTLSWATAAAGGASVTTSDTPPATPNDGDLWYDSVGGRTYVYYQDPNGSQWVDASPQGGGGSGTSITTGNTTAEVIDTGSDGRFVVTTEGSERLRVDSSGRLGVGTASPGEPLSVATSSPGASATLARLQNTGTTSGTEARLLLSTSTSTGGTVSSGIACIATDAVGNTALALGTGTTGSYSEKARLDSSGRLLVGTSSARDIATHSAKFQLEGVAYNNSTLQIYGNQSGTDGAYLFLGKSRGTTVGSVTVVQSGDTLGQIRFFGADGTSDKEAARIGAEVDGTPGTNDMPGRLVFSTTADGASSPTERMRITNAGYVAINGTGTIGGIESFLNVYHQGATTYGVIIANTSSVTGNAVTFRNTSNNVTVGSITHSTSATAYNTSSDYRLKENIVPLTGAAARLAQLPVHRFNFISDPGRTVDGFIAHEVQDVVPEAITGEKDAVDEEGNPIYQGIDQSKLVPLLTAALQEAVARIEAQDTTIASQAATIAAIEARLTALEGGN